MIPGDAADADLHQRLHCATCRRIEGRYFRRTPAYLRHPEAARAPHDSHCNERLRARLEEDGGPWIWGARRAALGPSPTDLGFYHEIGSLSAQVGQGPTCGGSPGRKRPGERLRVTETVRCMWQSQRPHLRHHVKRYRVPERTLSSAR